MLSQNEEETGQMLMVCRLVYSVFLHFRSQTTLFILSLYPSNPLRQTLFDSQPPPLHPLALLPLLVQKERKATGRHSIRKLFLNYVEKERERERENGWKRIMNACLLGFQACIGREQTEAKGTMIFLMHQTLGRNQR